VKRILLTVPMLTAICVSEPTTTLAQARGPSAQEIQQEGKQVQSMLEIRRQEWERDWGPETKAREQEEMRQDSTLSASRLAEADAFLRRLTGRFRIEGKIERKMQIGFGTGDPLMPYGLSGGLVPKSAKVAGVADCSTVGTGAGVNCVISASWPAFDRTEPPPFCKPWTRNVICDLFDPPFTAAEKLDTMRPAVLMLGLDTDPPQLRGMLVTADTLTNEWVGKLDGSSARMLQTQVCTTLRCYLELGITAGPDSEVVTFTLHQTLLWQITITLTMHRDPDAQLEKDLKPMKAH